MIVKMKNNKYNITGTWSISPENRSFWFEGKAGFYTFE